MTDIDPANVIMHNPDMQDALTQAREATEKAGA